MALLLKTYHLKALVHIACFSLAALCLPLFITTADAGQIPEKMIRRTGETLDADLIVSANALVAAYQKGVKPVFIDIRRGRDFDALHIPGAMNIPLHFIKTKSYLKSSPLVLVDQGLSSQRLAPACRELRTLGFDVRILDGGMNAWSRHGGSMTGEPVRQMAYCRISPADFFQEKNDAKRLICDVSAIRSQASQHLMPYALHLPLAGNPESRSDLMTAFTSAHARGGTATIIVVDRDGSGYRNVKPLFDQAGLKNVFYLDGGIDAYGKYLDGLALSWLPRAQRVKTDNSCRNCGDTFQGRGE